MPARMNGKKSLRTRAQRQGLSHKAKEAAETQGNGTVLATKKGREKTESSREHLPPLIAERPDGSPMSAKPSQHRCRQCAARPSRLPS